MTSPWRAAALGLDLATAACAVLNLAYFLHRLASRRSGAAARRVAAFALAVVSLGVMGESLLSLAFLMVPPAGSPLASPAWTLGRALPFAGTAFISLLVLRRLAAR